MIDSKRNIIIADSSATDGIVNDEMPYKFKDGQLHLIMSPEMMFILEKIK